MQTIQYHWLVQVVSPTALGLDPLVRPGRSSKTFLFGVVNANSTAARRKNASGHDGFLQPPFSIRNWSDPSITVSGYAVIHPESGPGCHRLFLRRGLSGDGILAALISHGR
jgi:hypothetical protein